MEYAEIYSKSLQGILESGGLGRESVSRADCCTLKAARPAKNQESKQ